MYGISGHKIAELEGNAEVTTYGEHGPYTIVSCGGRNGYVLTELLAQASDLKAEADEEVVQFQPAEEATKSSGAGVRILLLLLAIAGAASGAVAVLGLV